jgi:hypothetical protein
MRPITFACSILLLMCLPLSVAAQTRATHSPIPIPDQCSFTRPARMFNAMTDIPEVAAEFDRQGVAMADTGEPFIPFDVVDSDLPQRQFQRAYQFDDRVIVWYFHGGIGTHIHIVEMRQLKDAHEHHSTLRLSGRRLYGPPCVATQALLDGVNSTDDW